jgi:hypothetical protein
VVNLKGEEGRGEDMARWYEFMTDFGVTSLK